MIDPHVHLRDWEQENKETVKHGLEIAYKAGLDAVFEMPNTNPALISKEIIKKRISLADKAINGLGIDIFHGIYAGITNDQKQIEEAVNAHKELFPRVIGLKMFAGNSTGNMGIIKEENQKAVYKTLSKLNYKGVLALHCEKESELKNIFDSEKPITHTQARPSRAETESLKDQIKFANEAGYRGIMHICHISVPEALEEIEKARNYIDFKITCGATMHHTLLYDKMMDDKNGILLKMNPPLRHKEMQEYMHKALFDGKIDWIETDHAPHQFKEKFKTFDSGIPALHYYPYFIESLKKNGMPDEMIDNLTHNNIISVFGINILNKKRKPDYSLKNKYEFDPFIKIR